MVNLAFDPRGNLWTADYFGNCVAMVTAKQVAEGGLQAPSLTMPSTPDPPLEGPIGLLFDGGGNLWIGTRNEIPNRIYRFDAFELTEPNPQPAITIVGRGASRWFTGPASAFDFASDGSGDLQFTTAIEYVGHVPAELLASTD